MVTTRSAAKKGLTQSNEGSQAATMPRAKKASNKGKGKAKGKQAPSVEKTGAGVKKAYQKKDNAAAYKRRRAKVKFPADIITLLKTRKRPVYLPNEIEYERAVAHANLLYRFSRPTCIVQPENAAQVQHLVKLAKARDIPLTIKNGGHSYSGSPTTDHGLLLDLFKMNKVHLDIESMTMETNTNLKRSLLDQS